MVQSMGSMGRSRFSGTQSRGWRSPSTMLPHVPTGSIPGVVAAVATQVARGVSVVCHGCGRNASPTPAPQRTANASRTLSFARALRRRRCCERKPYISGLGEKWDAVMAVSRTRERSCRRKLAPLFFKIKFPKKRVRNFGVCPECY